MKRLGILVLASLLGLALGTNARAEEPSFTHQEDVIYGRKFGTALTLDVFRPKKNANGAAILFLISGGWHSDHRSIRRSYPEYLERGYTVFAVVHGSQPRFTIPEAVGDVQRAVRYIRAHAGDFHIDPERIGVTGGSAGGHLSLMLGTTGKDGNAEAMDPVERVSSRVQAVACFYPPSDFLNYGGKGKVALGSGTLEWLKSPFDFEEYDQIAKRFNRVLDEGRRRAIGKNISPIYHVSKQSAPTLIVHGDEDKIVPIQQAESMIARLKKAGVPAKLIVKHGKGHGWRDSNKDVPILVDWFDKYLAKKTASTPTPSKAGK
jgi:acetyl esterase/lipase